jgi:hypothetical protein
VRILRLAALPVVLLLLSVVHAAADVTLFAGSTTTPAKRAVRGVAVGGGVLAIGFEFEYADTRESVDDAAPRLRTGMGNVLIQTPVAIARVQPYFTTGGGLYREVLGSRSETQAAVNTGGGVKVKLVGPLRVRVDYRLFKLRGEPLNPTVHRIYVGANLAF